MKLDFNLYKQLDNRLYGDLYHRLTKSVGGSECAHAIRMSQIPWQMLTIGPRHPVYIKINSQAK
jgi:hypothetical protein